MIKDSINTRNIGISLWTDEALQQIAINSGPLSETNEYQIHYYSANLRTQFEDLSYLTISIPIVLFNYPQEVSGASIDFELKDVEDISNQLLPVVHTKISEIEEQLKLFDSLKMKFEITGVPLNTLHRHPGGRNQSFSGTDLHKSITKDTGIVFPLAEADLQDSFSSIIAHENRRVYLAHQEYRIATSSNKDILYFKGRSAAIVKAPLHMPSAAEQLFNYPVVDNSYIVYNNLQFAGTIKYISDIWNKINFEPSTQFIKESNLSKKSVTTMDYSYNGRSLYENPRLDYTVAPTKANREKAIDVIRKCIDIDFTIASEDTLKLLDKEDQIEHYKQLLAYYYGPEIDEQDLTNIAISDITELQDCIIEYVIDHDYKVIKEKEPELTKETAMSILVSSGYSKKELQQYSSYQLIEMCNNLFD